MANCLDTSLDSVQEIERWYTEIQLCSDRLHKEAYLLRAEKNVTETYLDELNGPLSIVGECLSMRDNRVCGELTLDAANAELKCELGIVENSMKLLKDQCQKAWEQLNRLNDVAGKLDIELLHKNEARSVDNQQKSINKLCLSVTFKTAAMRNPKKSVAHTSSFAFVVAVVVVVMLFLLLCLFPCLGASRLPTAFPIHTHAV